MKKLPLKSVSLKPFLTFSPSFPYITSLKSLTKLQSKDYNLSIQESKREEFWLSQSHSLSWFKPPAHILTIERQISGSDGLKGDKVLTFADGLINMCYNCIDRHLMPHHNNPAIFYAKSPVSYTTISYEELFNKVNALAHHLSSFYGLKANDAVLIYLPHVPEAIYTILACARLGVVYNIVPSTLDSKSLANKILHLSPKLIITSQDIRPKINFLANLNRAFSEASIINHRIMVFKSEDLVNKEEKLQGKLDIYQFPNTKTPIIECVPLSPSHPLSLNETSGTEGIPRGVFRDTAGLAVYLNFLMKNTFNFESRGLFYCAPGFSWTYGQNYGLFGPLLMGGATFLYDGEWSDPEIYWKLLANYKINSFLTFPRFIESAKEIDNSGKKLEKYDFSSLKNFTLTGERCNLNTFYWLKNHLTDGVILNDAYMQQETGFPIFHTQGGAPSPGVGFDVILAQKDDSDYKTSTHMGQILLTLPLPPGCVGNCSQKIFSKEIAVENKGKYYRTGDSGFIDESGKIEVSREDDIVTVGDYEFSTMIIEESLELHRFVKKICIVPALMKKDDKFTQNEIKKRIYVRGKGMVWKNEGVFDKERLPTAFVVLKENAEISKEMLNDELIHMIKNDISPLLSLKKIVIVKELPKNINGMVLKGLLNEMCLNSRFTVPKNIVNIECLKEIEDKIR